MNQLLFKFYILSFFVAVSINSTAQLFPAKQYPQQYFIWPVEAKIGLAANFGELRPNHYHMGLDCRTDQAENKLVYAAADGYVAKIKIEPWGFGRCLYVNHPNGMTTLYAHLNNFNTEIEKYITEQQYSRKSWNIFIDVPANLLKVKKGQMIAYSGNTGGSQGPHVHFEVRNTQTDKVLNPLLLGFPVVDNIAPDVLRIAVYDRNKSTYEQTPKIYPLKKVNGIYTVASGRINVQTDKVSLAITAWDRYTGSSNQNGIYKAIVYNNNNAISGFELDNISYDETRYLNAHIDYKTRASGGPWLQHLSPLPGYRNGVYKTIGNDGIITLDLNTEQEITIDVADANNNISKVKFTLNATSIDLAKAVVAKNTFMPGQVNVFENDAVRFYLPENAIYDYFKFLYGTSKDPSGATIHHLHNTTVPIQTNYPVSIKENFSLADTGKIVMKRFSGSKKDYKKATYKNGWYTAKFREFGQFFLMVDNTPPVINTNGFFDGMDASKLRRIVLSITDNTEELNSFEAYLDGKWLRFSNDKGKNFIYNFDDRCASGEHELKIIAEDQVGNKTEKTIRFTR